MSIRAATTADLPAIVEMGLRFHQGTRYRDLLSPTAGQILSLAEKMLASEDATILLASDGKSKDTLVGMIGLWVGTNVLQQRIAEEVAWWVDPASRGVIGVQLLRRGELWAIGRGAVVLKCGAPIADIEALCDRMGYQRVEVVYQKELG